MNIKAKKLISNTALFAIGSFSSHIISFLFLPLYTSVFSQTDYGIADLIFTTSSLLYPFTTVAIGNAVMRFSLDKGKDQKFTYSIGLLVSLIGFLILLMFSPLIKMTVFGNYTPLFLLYYFFHCLSSITSSFVRGLEKVFLFSFSGILSSLVTIICNITFLLVFKMGVEGYLLAHIMTSVISFLFLFIFSKSYRYLMLPWKIDFGLAKRMLKFSIPIVPNSISWWFANYVDRYMLSFFASVSCLGMYAVAQRIPSIISVIMSFLISAWEISAVENFGSDESKKTFSSFYNKYFMITFLGSAALIVMAKPIAFILYRGDFFEAWKYSSMLVIANLFYLLSAFFGTIYTTGKQTSILSVSTTVAAVANILLNLVLIPRFDIIGAIVATVASYVIVFLIRIINTKKIIEFYINLKRDIILIILLIGMFCLSVIDTIVSWSVCVVLFAGLLVVYRKFIFDLLSVVIQYLMSFIKKSKKSA